MTAPVLCDVGPVAMGETLLAVADLDYQGPGHSSLQLHNVGDRPGRAVLLGGIPFTEELVMWWNFVGRSHDDIVGYRQLWEDADDPFGAVRITGVRSAGCRPRRCRPPAAASTDIGQEGAHMTADKTGAPTTVTAEEGRYTIAVDGKTVGLADFADRGDQRVFYHTEVDPAYGGRGLATILVEGALTGARDEGKRVVPVCSMVVTVLKKHPEFDDITDPVTPDVQRWLQT